MSTPRRSLHRFLAYVWPYYGLIARATGAGMLKFVLPSTMALSLRFRTDRLVPAQGAFHLLMLTLVLVYAVWAVALYYRSQWAQLAGHRVMMDLRSDLYRHIHTLSHSFFQEKQSGGIVSRLTADIVLASMDGPLTLAALAVFPFVQIGSHAELSRQGGLYARLYEAQRLVQAGAA